MCGIAALYTFHTQQSHHSFRLRQELTSMLQCIRHRGPDGQGMFVQENQVALGMCRLAIVDKETGNQPIWNETQTVAIVCNGEIYNHQKLRKRLQASGHEFTTKSDVEVIVHLYEQYGEDCLREIEGIYAFALWDSVQKRLFVARDRLGVKPLYYTVIDGQIRFASELRALLVHRNSNHRISQNAFYAYNTFRYVPSPNTMVDGIHKLAPGQSLTVEQDRICKRIYWQPPTQLGLPNTHRQSRTISLRNHIHRAIASQLAPDVQSGILFSGGLDSTILLATYASLSDRPTDTYTVAFAKPQEPTKLVEYSELDYARQLANHFHANHIYDEYTADEVLACLPKIIASVDEPIADPTAIPLWFATRLAKQSGVRVLYSGEGLDEIFNGYTVYFQSHWLRKLQYIPKFIRSLAMTTLAATHLPGSGVLRRSLDPIWQWYQGVGGVFMASELEQFLTPAWLANDCRRSVRTHIRKLVNPVRNHSALTQMTHFDVRSWLPENTLVKSDKVSMSHSIELRVPFLDHQLVEFALQCTDREKLRRHNGKWLVRRFAKEIVPASVLNRPKAGFPVPITAWIFGEWRDYVHETLMHPQASIREMYKPDKIEHLFKLGAGAERSRAGRMLWTLLALELWMKTVYKKDNTLPYGGLNDLVNADQNQQKTGNQ